MEKEQFERIINEILKNNPQCWIGIHDCHYKTIGDEINKTGLSVSYNPFGRKVRRFCDENGNIDLTNNFMTTIDYLTNKQYHCFSLPVEPVIIIISEKVLKKLNLPANEEESYKKVCGYGKMQLIKNSNIPDILFRLVEPCETKKDANIRLLPSCFVAGYFDMTAEKFVDNPDFFENLSIAKQDEIIEQLIKFEQEKQSHPQ